MLLQNLSRLLEDPRRRHIILITLVLLLTMILVGGIRLFHQIRGKHLPGASRIESMQPIRSVPGGMKESPAPAYTKLQMEQNKKMAEQAKKTGKSAIATIVDGFSLVQPLPSSHAKKPQKSYYGQPAALMSEAERAIASHQAFMSQQQTELTKQQIQGAMQQQMNQLFNTWNYTPTQAHEMGAVEAISSLPSPGGHDAINGSPLVKAGTILHAVLLTEINSDEPSPVLAQITTGDFKEARLIGTLSRVGERLLVQFHTLNVKQSTQALSINALAVDEGTARTSLASHVDRHVLLRYGSLFAAAFLQGYGMVLQNNGSRLMVNQSINDPNLTGFLLPTLLNPKGQLLSATGNVGMQFSSELAQRIHRPPTVYVHAGTAIGILFTTDLVDHSLSKV